MRPTTTLNSEELAHEASNEAISILMGVQVLGTMDEGSLSPQYLRAIQILQESATRLVELVDCLKEQRIPPAKTAEDDP